MFKWKFDCTWSWCMVDSDKDGQSTANDTEGKQGNDNSMAKMEGTAMHFPEHPPITPSVSMCNLDIESSPRISGYNLDIDCSPRMDSRLDSRMSSARLDIPSLENIMVHSKSNSRSLSPSPTASKAAPMGKMIPVSSDSEIC